MFYEIAATVIPVLFLALVYQAQFHRVEGGFISALLRYAVGYGAVIFAVVGEWVCFKVLGRGFTKRHDNGLVSLALLLLGAFVVIDPILWAGRGAADGASAVLRRYGPRELREHAARTAQGDGFRRRSAMLLAIGIVAVVLLSMRGA